ncbi:hypothetical protein N6L24_04190 [Cognatishimia sp. SS12]|uniref:hypothetical protein n=1 Tax=Cognatishimia sp. SS12 TaxID=2979465 RepID=UPI00232E173C|nr:hypothetical protein [Cognatishimia sp. SS12]MDC0737464.1 hypothetical protein [Cognatishimia sp. SS12]
MTKHLIFMIGAHKTASTHFQRSMSQNAALMAEHDVAVIAPQIIGSNLFPLANLLRERIDPRLTAGAGDAFLEHYVGEAGTALLMNENISGNLRPNMLMEGDRFYRFAPKRMARLAQLFPGQRHTISLAIRNPARFLVSAWQENMKGHAFNSFDSYVSGIDLTALSWSNLIFRLRKTIDGPVDFMVWRYEDYETARQELITEIAGEACAAQIAWLDRAANQGLSAQGLAYLEALGEDITAENRAAAEKLFPRGPDFPGFAPYSDKALADLTARYDADWEVIQQMPHCRTFPA